MRLCGISRRFQLLSPCTGQVTHALLTRPPLKCFKIWPKSHQRNISVRLACVKHAASVHPEPGSNSLIIKFVPSVSFCWLPFLLLGFHSLNFSLLEKCFFLFEIFRVALLFICQGSVCCRSSTQHCYVITTCLVCQQLFSLFFHCFFISFSAVDFHSNTTFFDCQLLFFIFSKMFFHSGNMIRQ